VFSQRSPLLKRSYYAGIGLWSRWLPVCAVGIYLAILTVNLASGGSTGERNLTLNGFFSVPEIIALFLVGPLFLTRIGNLLAAATLVYCGERLLLLHPPGTTAALYLVTGSLTFIAVIGDKMPWHPADAASAVARRLREVLVLAVALGALAITFTALIKAHGFARWATATFGMPVTGYETMLLLVAVFVGWLAVALGFSRHLVMPVLLLPSLFVLAYVSSWPSHLLVMPFSLCFALSLAAAERRVVGVRRGPGVAQTVLLNR
jgi:hypothetical protein